MSTERYDDLVLGSGAGGKLLSWHLARAGRRTAVVERTYIGGSCRNINARQDARTLAYDDDVADDGIDGGPVMANYVLPELQYNYAALEPHYEALVVELHHDKHHAGYVNGANATLEKLAEARDRDDFAAINQLQKNLAFHLSGHVLHSLFWRNLSPRGGGEPDGELAAGIREFFGSFAGMKGQLAEAALGVQGSGWGALAWEPLGKRLVVEQVYDHQGNIGNGTVPLLVLDMWEHAYYLQYQNVKGDWVKAFWKIVNWEDVAERFRSVRSLDLAL